MQLQAHSVAEQTIEQRIRSAGFGVFAQTLGPQTQTGDRGFRIVREGGKKLLYLRMALLFAPRIVKKCRAAAD